MPPTRISHLVIDRMARIGFVAKGLVAAMVGGVALRLALGNEGGLVGPEGALRQFMEGPAGRSVLVFLAISLWAHAAWKLVQTFYDPEDKGHGITALAERAAFAVSALGYAALGLGAAQLAVYGWLEPGRELDQLAGGVLGRPLGRTAIGVAGTIVLIAGLLQIRLGFIAGFRNVLHLDRMAPAERMIVLSLGRAGYVALGVVSAVIGYFLLRVAITFNPNLAGGWRDALGFVARVGDTRWPLAFVAAGLTCYGLYFMLQARYRRVDPL